MSKVCVEVYGMLEKVEYIAKNKLLKMNVRYVQTDTEISQYDIYEDNETGEFYATTL